ncbi:MAG TPA: bifunctional phosphopantothenoylcysteine decarboxylase/phosphopantothenate--cysteine ligase CoaBC [Candidatus Dormibacteraeota bacterium]|nr:bifunctional phosphopantothenoylcysteine decarboxylase/phosphopantothenate--cysteine ligase CoaBC [Candidatus Dormibacteraeota bacterium]
MSEASSRSSFPLVGRDGEGAGRLQGRRVVIAVSGGIAAYKAIEVIRQLTEVGAEVRVMMTPEATQFVTPLTLEALSYHPVAGDWLTPAGGGERHIALAEWAEVIAVVPATANTIAKLALGLADELVSGTVLASRAPLVVAPAMNDLMFTHPQTQDHLAALRSRHAVIVEPAVGRLASGKSAIGRLAAPERIVAAIEAILTGRRTLEGLRVVVSAGGTREAVDPVRYVGNFSSGKMGRALAEVAAARGADVTLVTTLPSNLEGINEVAVGSADDMLAALRRVIGDADVLVMAAAVADYAPEKAAEAKLKRSDKPIDLRLRPNVDILKALGTRPGLFRVGFAAETQDLRGQAEQKLAQKQLDMLVANQIGLNGQGLGSDFNAVTILAPSGVVTEVPRLPKWEVAARIWDAIDARRNG